MLNNACLIRFKIMLIELDISFNIHVMLLGNLFHRSHHNDSSLHLFNIPASLIICDNGGQTSFYVIN